MYFMHNRIRESVSKCFSCILKILFQIFYFENFIVFWKVCRRMYFINSKKCVLIFFFETGNLKITLKKDKIVKFKNVVQEVIAIIFKLEKK